MMKNKNKIFPQQTHFVGVLVPEDITLTLEDCRRYMNERYGCMSGYGTHNFDAFGDRTIYAKVLRGEKWTVLRDKVLAAVLKAAPGCTKKDQRTFQPHLTVANRDIPAGVSTAALEVMNELNLVEDFPVDNITIFERKGGKWEAAWSGEL